MLCFSLGNLVQIYSFLKSADKHKHHQAFLICLFINRCFCKNWVWVTKQIKKKIDLLKKIAFICKLLKEECLGTWLNSEE